jgi:prevent-host-death family protein
MKRANVAHLKAHLSQYLAETRRGHEVVVYDRNTPIARLVPFEEAGDRLVVREALRPVSDLRRVRGVKPRRRVDVMRLLRESREPR